MVMQIRRMHMLGLKSPFSVCSQNIRPMAVLALIMTCFMTSRGAGDEPKKSVPGAEPMKDALTVELERFGGTWVQKSSVDNGKVYSYSGNVKWTFSNKKMSKEYLLPRVKFGAPEPQVLKYEIELDLKAEPKVMW